MRQKTAVKLTQQTPKPAQVSFLFLHFQESVGQLAPEDTTLRKAIRL
jgi:hypothetical protein